ncbi:MAG: GGDEF domain-containing protein [Methylophilaceae bacterium]|nr:GGDEF domain-containing protein [Methylophilaceae bacterium]
MQSKNTISIIKDGLHRLPPQQVEAANSANQLNLILQNRQLSAVFQPIVNMTDATILGHEGLIRGPKDKLHRPLDLFSAAREHSLINEVECLSRKIVLEQFAQAKTVTKLFVNISPECLTNASCSEGLTALHIYDLGLDPHNIIIELTESSPTFDYDLLRKATDYYRNMGFEIAMDDLGEGFSSLRLWSELQPDYVKIDKHFIKDINKDAIKLEFVKSIQQIAENSGAQIIAEGIETKAELNIVKELGLAYGQGYLLGMPADKILHEINESVRLEVIKNKVTIFPPALSNLRNKDNLTKLIRYSPAVQASTTNDEVYRLFENNARLYSIAVVEHAKPVGLISRYAMIDRFARPYQRELYGKKSCAVFMDAAPLIVEKNMGVHELSDLITNMEPHHLSNGFIITEAGKYLGLGSGHDLLREITQMQIKAARYANPLTLLPGNVPINEHVDKLLDQKLKFLACYCDLDNFKPFNDAYGFGRGDDLIKFTGKLLTSMIAADVDFVGHVGGDDFILILQSEDWEARCLKILSELAHAMPDFYDADDRTRGGVEAIDRLGNKTFYPLGSMSIGAVAVNSEDFSSHHEVFGAIARAKKQAKLEAGNSLFLERRSV